MKPLIILIISLFAIMITGCGKPGINLNNAPYNPKITVEGYLYPGQTISNIRLMRNFPIGIQLNPQTFFLTPSGNDVTATINGNLLKYDSKSFSYYNNQIKVGYGKRYTLEVYATLDGTKLHTTSTTITPQKGFFVLNKNLGTFKYGNAITINYMPSPGTGFYAFSIVPDSASTKNFIYDNNLRKNIDSSDVADHLNEFKFRYGTVDNINSLANNTYSFSVSIRNTWFYSAYTVVAYACDDNFKDFVLTAPNVQEIDGNFHEPVETFQGDGIGVFGSAIADTVRYTIIK